MVARVLPAERSPAELLERATGRVHPMDKAFPRAKKLERGFAFLQAQTIRS
jgi:hypothetical protein